MVILNSDVMHHEGSLVRDRLMPPLVRLFEVCRDQKHVVLIPLTARLEFDRYQSEMAERERTAVANAYALLDRHRVPYETIDPAKLAAAPNLLDLIKSITPDVNEVEPTHEELREAHRRATMHLPPHPPGSTKSDEMRDLVIWVQAVGIASKNRGALLISRDGVHTGDLGDEEASQVGLIRMSKLDEAVEYLEVRTPAGKEFESLLKQVWPDLVQKEARLPSSLTLRSVRDAVFVEGESASAAIRAAAPNNEVVTADVEIRLSGLTIEEVKLENVRVGNVELPGVSISPKRVRGEGRTDVDERLADLREVLES